MCVGGERGETRPRGSARGSAWSLAWLSEARPSRVCLPWQKDQPGQAEARSPGAGPFSTSPPSVPEAENGATFLSISEDPGLLIPSLLKCKCSWEPHMPASTQAFLLQICEKSVASRPGVRPREKGEGGDSVKLAAKTCFCEGGWKPAKGG